MKNFLNKLVAVLLMALATVGYSCQDCDHEPYDDTELREQIADLYSKLTALENKVNANMQTVEAMMAGRTAIQSYEQDKDGNWVLTLTDGKQITIYAEYEPEALPTSLIYVMEVEIDGVKTKVWATMGADGQLTPLMDGANYIPVVPEEVEIPTMPTIPSLEYKVEDGKIWIKLSNSEQWIETGMTDESLDDLLGQGGACGITKVVFNTAENQQGVEETISATFTLSDGSTFTVAMDGVCNFAFEYYGDVIDCFYLAPGTTTDNKLILTQNLLVDFIKEVPQGWTIAFGEKDLYGEYPITLTAPTAAAIESGAAVAEGTIKLIGVFEGGKTAIAKLTVTTKGFKTISMANGQVVIEPNAGISGYTYGILPAADYNAATLKNTLETIYLPKGLWKDWQAPYHAVSNDAPIEKSVTAVYGQALTPGVKYVLWAALLSETYDEVAFDYIYSLASDFETVSFSELVVEATATNITFNDIVVKINFQGFDRYYGGIMQSSFFSKESQLSMINDAYKYNMVSYLTSYANDTPTVEASLTSFPCADISGISFSTSYTMWIIPIEEGKTEYAEEDMRIFEWTSANLEAGSSLMVTEVANTFQADYTSLSVNLKADDGASEAYYKWYATSNLPAESELAMDVLTTGTTFDAMNPTAAAYNLTSNTEYTLVAIAVDADGKYGQICKFAHKTNGITFSETFKLTIEKQAAANPFDDATKASFKPTVEGGTAERYYYMNLTDSEVATWGSDDAIAAELAVGTNRSNTKYLTNGCIVLNYLTTGTQYTFFIVAFDGTNYSKMQKITYTPTTPTINVISASDARWEASKPTVTIDTVTPPSSGTYSMVTFTVTPAAGTKVEGGHLAPSAMSGNATEQITTIMTGGISSHYITALAEAKTFSKAFNINTTKLYLTWTDAEGNYYEPMAVTVSAE
ncbi:MAG: hypothetical protein IJ028_02260 [Alistipes sp.]|nr:hypothetical protein [Alistipes sp.]